ncbi:hypothetical protein ASE86_02920 [Sphingomonas sp. Leaf33]|uniref:hypothetical protein n=1 Tax=Sphingomonas sp. Leaf33 TaxID=1736215 RepID=UPI0006F45CD4|nr:hypothetical protein [Sphingomonas sp. Leaf33]KQN25225.1 hypothetical protein ASE86_02920 [Sphingomonas sp. Leaf33]
MADTPPTREPVGAGAPFILLLVAGVVIGLATGQVTLGFIGGALAGIAVGVLLYLRDRRRS